MKPEDTTAYLWKITLVKYVKTILLRMKFTLFINAYNLDREKFFPKFNAYFNITEMDAYDQFCNILKLDNIKLLVDYVNKLWNSRKSILVCFLNPCQYKNIYL